VRVVGSGLVVMPHFHAENAQHYFRNCLCA
jgi:hypothetical protein